MVDLAFVALVGVSALALFSIVRLQRATAYYAKILAQIGEKRDGVAPLPAEERLVNPPRQQLHLPRGLSAMLAGIEEEESEDFVDGKQELDE